LLEYYEQNWLTYMGTKQWWLLNAIKIQLLKKKNVKLRVNKDLIDKYT
jgi:hypothetical protein